MLNIANGKEIPVLIAKGQAAVVQENMLRITGLAIDFTLRTAQVVYHRGLQNPDGSFQITDRQPVVIELRDEPARPHIVDRGNGQQDMEIVDRSFFTQLTTQVMKTKNPEYPIDELIKLIDCMVVDGGFISDEIGDVNP